MRRVFITLIILAMSTAGAYASCGAAACPLDTRSSLDRTRGLLRVGYEFEYIDQDQPRISTHKAAVGEISGHHDEQRTINRIHRFSGTWAPTNRWSFDLALPLISRSHRHIHNHHGGAEIIPQGWDFSGVGDLSVQTRFAFIKPEEKRHPTLSAILGGEFPTGENEVQNASGDEAELGITPGSGSYDALYGLASVQHFSMPTLTGEYALMPFFFSIAHKLHGEGQDDYQLGYQLSANVGTTYPLSSWLGVIGQLNFLAKGKDAAGLTREEVEKTGGEYLYLSPGLQIRLGDTWEWSSVVQLPVYQRVNEIQLTSDYNFQTGLYYKFQL